MGQKMRLCFCGERNQVIWAPSQPGSLLRPEQTASRGLSDALMAFPSCGLTEVSAVFQGEVIEYVDDLLETEESG